MKNNIVPELRVLTEEQLHDKLDTLRRELFSLKLNASTTHIKDYSQFKKLKKDIARAAMVLNEKRQRVTTS